MGHILIIATQCCMVLLLASHCGLYVGGAPQSNVLLPADPNRDSVTLRDFIPNDVTAGIPDNDVTKEYLNEDEDDVTLEEEDDEVADHEAIEEVVETLLQEERESLDERFEQVGQGQERIEDTVDSLARQMMLQQLFIEERIRSDGHSGIKQMRLNYEGTRPYYAPHHSGKVLASIHDHSNNDRTIGLGEFIAVLNGVEFRTRHNDYRLLMPSRDSQEYHATEEIPYPDVPPEVLNKSSIDEQIEEMRTWFKAFRKQDKSIRDYTKYFKPVLCYLEGAWTKADGHIDESFPSDRHNLDARTWYEMQEKVRFTSYTGRKDRFENYAYLPTTIVDVVNKTKIIYAQWNYRILCHPLKEDLPLKNLRLVDDLVPRMVAKRKYADFHRSRAARFELYDVLPLGREQLTQFSLLDKLMTQIPGKNNYPGKVVDSAFGIPAMDLQAEHNRILNAGYYHRWYKTMNAGAMGLNTRHRGFSDENLFVAFNTQDKVTGMKLTECKGHGPRRRCNKYSAKVSYAIPLEIIYLTPLSKWNPYDLEHKGDAASHYGKTVTAKGRTGSLKSEKAYNGTNSKVFYRTPAAFFTGGSVGADLADTTKGTVGVLDSKGIVRAVKASGIRIFLPKIEHVGSFRTRYPIMPVHGEGSAVWKELEALKDMVFEMSRYKWLYRRPPNVCEYCQPPPTAPPAPSTTTTQPTPAPPTLTLSLARSQSNQVAPHSHVINLSKEEYKRLHKGDKVIKYTSENNGHSHQVSIVYTINEPLPLYKMISCDGKVSCWDEHGPTLAVVDSMRTTL